jgi:Cu/Ag efflux pump CusA
MLTRIIRWSFGRPRLLAAMAAVLFLLGAGYVRTLRVEVFPAIAPAQMAVQTEAPGLVADQVEQIITRPLEAVLSGAPGIASIRSESAPGLSVITLGLARAANAGVVRQAVAERLAQAALPADAAQPRIAPLTAPTGDVLQVGFTSDRLNPMALRDQIQWVVRPRLLASAGVANVTVYGGQTRRIEVRARPGDLSDSDLGFLDVIQAVRRATSVAGAGFVDTPDQRVLIDPRGQALTPDDVAAGQIQVVGNAPTRIGDVADVGDTPAPATGDALIMGKPGVLLGVQGQYGADTLQTTRAVQAALAQMEPALRAQGIFVTSDLDRPASFIDGAIRGLIFDLMIGGALVALALLWVLRDARAVLAVFLAIAPSLMAALVAIKALGLTLNTMTLGGLFIAAAIVIDDAVIDVESIVTRLRAARAGRARAAQAILAALLEVRAPVIYATLLIDIALAPMLFVGGVLGPFLAPLALTTIVASLTSLAVAICLTPAVAILLLQGVKPRPEHAVVTRAKGAYGQWIERRCHDAKWAHAVVLVALAVTFMTFALSHRPAAPSFHDGRLVAHFDAPTSTSLSAMGRIGGGLTRAALAVPGVARASERIGRDPTDFSAWGPEQSDIDLDLDPRLSTRDQDRVQARLIQALSAYPDVNVQIRPGLDLAQTAPEDRAPFAVAVYGDDLSTIDAAAQRIARGLRSLPGAGDVAISTGPRAPSIRIDLNFRRLALYGLSAADVLDTVQAAFSGKTVAQVYQNGRAIDLAVVGPDSLRQDPEGIGSLLLRSSSGLSTPLKSVANVYLTEARTLIQHEGGLRREVVTADPSPSDARRFGRQAKAFIAARTPAPPGVFLTFSDIGAAAAADRSALLVSAALAALAMIALLLMIFRDRRMAVLILGSTVFAFVGGAVAVVLTGAVLSLGSIAGFVALFGLSTRNAILLVSRPGDMAAARKAPWTMGIVKESAVDRAAPIALTALLVVAVFTPLVILRGQIGAEILGPLADVIVGGAISGAALTLLFMPALIHAYLCPVHRHELPKPFAGPAPGEP